MRVNQYLKFISKLAIAKFTKRRVPLIVILCVTNRCNLNCWYCYGEHPHRNNRPDFTTAELLDIIKDLGRMGVQILQLQGGEPLLRGDLEVVIKEARRQGMSCDMVTNGTLILQRKEIMPLLDKVCISLDGPAHINDFNRGEGSWERIIEGIKFARSCSLSVRISAVLTERTTREDIDWLVDFSKRYYLSVNFSPPFDFIPRFGTNQTKSHKVSDERLRMILGYIWRRKIEGAPIQFSAQSYNIARQWPFSYCKSRARLNELPAGFPHPHCYHGDLVVFIDSDGSVYPCCNFWGDSKWNIRLHGLQEAIFGLGRNGCSACYIPAYIDRNLFFGNNINTWRNYITEFIKGRL